MNFLASPYFQAPAIPLLLLLIKPSIKKLVRGPTSPFVWSDFYLGIDFLYGTLSSSLVFLGYLSRRKLSGALNAPTDAQLINTIAYIAVLLALLVFAMVTHQQYEPRPGVQIDETARNVWLAGNLNLIGGGALVVFVVLIQGVR